MCTIYFVYIGTFVGDEIPPPPNDLSVDIDEEMAEMEDHGDKCDPDLVQIPVGLQHRPDT